MSFHISPVKYPGCLQLNRVVLLFTDDIDHAQDDLRVGIPLTVFSFQPILHRICEVICHALLGIDRIAGIGPEDFVEVRRLLFRVIDIGSVNRNECCRGH